jgi:hypothetical protein
VSSPNGINRAHVLKLSGACPSSATIAELASTSGTAKMCEFNISKRYFRKLSVGVVSLFLARPLAVAPVVLAPVLSGQLAAAEIDCTHGTLEVCKLMAKEWCTANPQ